MREASKAGKMLEAKPRECRRQGMADVRSKAGRMIEATQGGCARQGRTYA
jgi:hypothetical protein